MFLRNRPRLRQFVIAPALVLSLAACATLSPGAEKVLITSNPDTVKSCQLLGQVKGSDHMWGGAAGQGLAEDNATTRLRNKAAQMGANVVFLSRSSTGFSGSSQLGEAYLCPNLPPIVTR